MLKAVTAEQSRLIEGLAVERQDVTLSALMMRAGRAVADLVNERYPDGRIAVLAGPGNNGGDGWVAASRLLAFGRDVCVYSLRAPDTLSGEAAGAAAEAVAAGVAWSTPAVPDPAHLAGCAVVIDALLGTGAKLPLREPLSAWLAALRQSGASIVSVDVPTGTDTDTGAIAEMVACAELTVTFTTPKRSLVVYPAAEAAGEVRVADIGIDPRILAGLAGPELWSDAEYAALLPRFRADIHKNERGRVLVVAGSGRFPGAAVLTARGAMRMGAGYVTVAVPDPIVPVVQSHVCAAPVVGLPSSRTRTLSSSAAAVVIELAGDHDVVVLGPGLTLSDGAVAAVRGIVGRSTKPLVIDADGLNALVDAQELLDKRTASTVLTPHPGELSRLLETTTADVQRDRVSSSARLAGHERVVVLKGAGTVVSGEDRQVVVTAGTPALATAGTGDVLAGIVGTLLAQGLGPLEAGALGAHIHARAGEVAAAELTPSCVTSEDIPDRVPPAVAELLGSW